MLKLIMIRKQSGVTLLETILVLSLIAIIMIGGLKLYRDASEESKSNQAVAEVSAIVAGVKSLYVGQRNYAGIHQNIIIPSGVIPSTTKTGNHKYGHLVIWNIFGGYVSFSDETTDYTDDSFKLWYTQIPNYACIKLYTTDMGQVNLTDPVTASNNLCGVNGNNNNAYLIFK